MNVTMRQRLRYFFDKTLSKGTKALVMWLAIFTFFLILFFALIYLAMGIRFENSGRLDFWEAFWQSFVRALDPGTVAGDTIWALRIVGVFVTVSGIFILSSLIGILSAGLDTKLEELRKGRSLVITENHTLIIGWSAKIIHIIQQLIVANENQKKASIVILSEKDKTEMEDLIKDKISDRKTTQIICRTGNALEASELKIVNPNEAKSIIILTPENLSEKLYDVHVIKSILALTYNKERKKDKYHIVAEIRERDNLDAAETAGGDEVSLIFSKDVISKITAQTSHQSGLSIIYMDLLAYEGDEIYLQKQPELVGKTYKDLLFAYETSSVIGIKKSSGKIFINPPIDIVFEQNDEVIAISEDDDTVILSGKTKFNIDKDLIIDKEAVTSIHIEHNLILGWNAKAPEIILEIDNYVAEGSETTVIARDYPDEYLVKGIQSRLKNQKFDLKVADYSKRDLLLNIDIEKFQNIIILANDDVSVQMADAITLMTLIHLRNISKTINKKFNIISEMFDQKNRELAEVTEADDFIISHDFISRILAQVSETKDIKKILDILFDSEGSEIYLKNVEDYVKTGFEMNFYTVIESASRKGHTAIGYRIVKETYNYEKNYGIRVNPEKSKKIKFSPGDKIIVLAED